MAGEGDGAGVGQPPPWRIPTVPEVEERSFDAVKVKEALVKLACHTSSMLSCSRSLLSASSRCCCCSRVPARCTQAPLKARAVPVRLRWPLSSICCLPPDNLQPAVSTAFITPAVPLAAAMASGERAELTLMLRRSAAPHLPAGTDALQKIQTCLVLVEAALTAGTLSLTRCTRRSGLA